MNRKIDFIYLNEQDMIRAGVTDMPSEEPPMPPMGGGGMGGGMPGMM